MIEVRFLNIENFFFWVRLRKEYALPVIQPNKIGKFYFHDTKVNLLAMVYPKLKVFTVNPTRFAFYVIIKF